MTQMLPRRFPRFLMAIALISLVTACHHYPPVGLSPTTFRNAVSGADWTLARIKGQPAPVGVGGRPATLRFDADSARVSGFAGCNRYFGSYTTDLTALRFRSVGMTKMACAEGMSLEQQLMAALDSTRFYNLSAGTLVLLGDSGSVATFTRPVQ
jgi:heat shock protein HslJ